jgi:hypothetical protein
MRLGSVAKQKVRHLVGLIRDLHDERYRVYEATKEKRDVLAKLRGMHQTAQRELDEMLGGAGGRLYGPGAREQEDQHYREKVAEAAGRVFEVEAEIAKLDLRHKALEADSREANAVAEGAMKLVDGDEQLLRDELDWTVPGVNAPRALPRR